MKNFTKAFTLIELLIVIVIIGILAVALIPRLTGAQARARDIARIADMRQMQTALELYNVENGKYPGNSHYASVQSAWCTHPINWWSWTGIFDSAFMTNYLSSLPRDPLSSNPSYCYGYSRIDDSALSCIAKNWTITHFDGRDASNNLTWVKPWYVLTFKSENDLWDKYPRLIWDITRYCIIVL